MQMQDQSVTDRLIQSFTDSGWSADRLWKNWSLYMHTYILTCAICMYIMIYYVHTYMETAASWRNKGILNIYR